MNYNELQFQFTMIYNQLQSITITYMIIYIHLHQLLQSITIISMTIYKRYDKQLQYCCNKTLGSVHNGLSTKADGLLTKVQATCEFTVFPDLVGERGGCAGGG